MFSSTSGVLDTLLRRKTDDRRMSSPLPHRIPEDTPLSSESEPVQRFEDCYDTMSHPRPEREYMDSRTVGNTTRTEYMDSRSSVTDVAPLPPMPSAMSMPVDTFSGLNMSSPGALMMNEMQLRQIQHERSMIQANEVASIKSDVHLVKREVSDLKSMVLQIGLKGSPAAAPTQVVVNTQNNISQDVSQRDTGDGWAEFNKTLRMFFSSPVNRFFFFGTVGYGMYVYHQRVGHTWRMNEIQRRIDSNVFLRMSQWIPRPQ